MSLGDYNNRESYKKSYESAYQSLKNASASFDTTYTQMMGSMGWDAKSKAGLTFAGFMADLFSFGGASKRAKQRARADVDAAISNAKISYEGFSRNISNYRTQAMHLVNTTRSNFDATFGANSYDMFDSLFNSAIETGSIDSLIQALQTNSDIEQAGTVNTLLEHMSAEQREKLLTSNMSINDINDSYYNYLSEFFGQQNTQYGYQMQQMSQREAYLDEQNRAAMANVQQQYAQQISSMVEEQRQKNRSIAESMGSTSAEAGSSGIRRNKATNAEILQKYETMLDAVAYTSALNYVLKQYENNLKTTQSGYLYQAYEIRNSMSQSTQSMIANYVAQGNQKQNSQIDFVYKIEDAERDAMDAIAEYNALKDAEAQYDKEQEEARIKAQELMNSIQSSGSNSEDSEQEGTVGHDIEEDFKLDTNKKGETKLPDGSKTDLGGTLALQNFADTNAYKYQPNYSASNFEIPSIADTFGPSKFEMQSNIVKPEDELPANKKLINTDVIA